MSDAKIQSRKFQITINNPHDCGMTHDVILDRAALFHPAYFCMADEIGEQGTYHTHVFLFSHSPTLAEERMTMLIVTHEIDFAAQVADHIIFMADGVIVERGKARELVEHPQNERTKAFLAGLRDQF